MFIENLRFFEQKLHLRWPVQTFKMGQKLEFALYELTYYGQKKGP